MLRLLSYRQIQFWEVHINWLVISTHQNLAIIATFMFKASSLRFQANEMDKNLTLKACSNLAKMSWNCSFHWVLLFQMFSWPKCAALTTSVTRLGNFWNFFVTNFISKVAQMFCDFLCSCENHHFLSQTGEATFWVTFGETWATFYFKIWSHCLRLIFQYFLSSRTSIIYFYEFLCTNSAFN